MIKHEKAKQRADRVRECRLSGLCIDGCGRTVGTNNDGTTSVRCDECKVPPSRRKVNAASLKDTKYPRPKVKYDADGEPDAGWLDSKEFAAYTVMVKDLIDRHKGGIWLGTLHRLLGGRAMPEWTPSALRNLMFLGVIEERWGCPVPYAPCEPHPIKDMHFKNSDKHVSIDKTIPYAALPTTYRQYIKDAKRG